MSDSISLQYQMKAVFIIGPSGSGKTTLTRTLSKAHNEYFGSNSSIIINLDCANQGGEIDICSLATLQEVMEELQLGPNGSLIYVAQLLQKNLQWLQAKIIEAINQRNHSASILNNEHLKKKIKPQEIQINNILLIFDLPGQIQLFLAHDSLKNIVYSLIKKFSLQPCVLGLFDSTYIYNLADFTSMTMVSLSILCNLQLPYIGILSKIDLCAGRRPSDGSFEGYFTLSSLHQLLEENKSKEEEQQLLLGIAKLIDQYSQVTFTPFSIYKPDLMSSLFAQLENTFGTMQGNLLNNRKFMNVFKEFVDDLGSEGVRINLEAQLLAQGEQELDYQEQFRKIRELK